MVLNGADQNQISENPRQTDGTGIELTVAGFPQVSNLMNNGHRVYAGYSNGILDHFSYHNIYSTTSYGSGLSGGPLYTTADKTVLGINTTHITATDLEGGIIITRPILQFMYNNQYLVY